MEKYKISIIIPVYNGSNYMAEAIDSALAQTYKNKEIIVVNDGSNDDGSTEKTALSYGDKIKYISKENGGSSSALNCGIRNMTGDYFSWLSHDDLYTPDKLEKSAEKINPEFRDKQVIICGSELIDAEGNKIFHPKKELEGDFDSTQMIENISNNFQINGCSVLVPKTVIDEVGFFDENFVYVNDTDYWYRLMLNDCIFTCFTDKLVKTRMHGGQVSVKKANLFKIENAVLAEKVFGVLLEDGNTNINKIKIFMKKASKDGNKKAVINAKKVLKKNKKWKPAWGLTSTVYYLYGVALRMAKKIYKKFFFKR